jgi:OOP family OmpA-OmpF porin
MNSPFAAAADSGWYGGLGIGQTRAKIDDAKITSGLLGSGFTVTSIDDDKHDTGYKIFGGLKINKNFAVEAGYFDLGKFGFTANTAPTGTLTGNIKLKGLNIDAVGILPITEKFSGFGRIGLQYAQAKDSFAGTGSVAVGNPNPSKSAANYKVGLGVQYDLTKSLGLRGEWERYRINDAVTNRGDIDMLSVGLVFMFGADDKPAPRAETPPAPPPVQRAAAPVLVIVPVMRTQQYCSILDIQFEIAEDEIQRESKEKLAVLGTFMKKYPDTWAVIEGHTDEVGTEEENMKLSQRRAQSVVDYLVSSQGIARSRLSAVGYGETRPIADNRTEEGKRANRRIHAVIACATDIEGLKVVPARVTMALDMEYDINKADVRPQYREELRKVADFMKANPRVTATVEGHTANLQSTTPQQEREMAQRRAQNVVNYLVDNFGIDRSRLSAEGYGATRRYAYNTSLEGQRENRRVNIIINYPK